MVVVMAVGLGPPQVGLGTSYQLRMVVAMAMDGRDGSDVCTPSLRTDQVD